MLSEINSICKNESFFKILNNIEKKDSQIFQTDDNFFFFFKLSHLSEFVLRLFLSKLPTRLQIFWLQNRYLNIFNMLKAFKIQSKVNFF